MEANRYCAHCNLSFGSKEQATEWQGNVLHFGCVANFKKRWAERRRINRDKRRAKCGASNVGGVAGV